MLNRGDKLGHYAIVEKLGEGGMGIVFRARDEHLNRDVAIKVLPAGTLGDEHARKRFGKEAEALAKLNHPHIATVHDFDTQEGVDFLVMEDVEGTTLAEKLKAGPLPEKELAGVGVQVAEALSEAHEQGIVHRDLKPGNLKLTPKGQVKILDFGIAKLLKPLSEATTESFTESHLLAGTLPYMSPEHLRGEAVDARSDLYSFGVVLYELATGRRPFEQKVSTALSDAILHQAPPSPARLKPELSPRLEEMILKCLEKEPENRYQSAREIAVDLRRLAAPAALPLAPSPQPAPRFLAGAPAWGRIGSWWQVPPGPPMRVALGLVAVAVVAAVLLGFNIAGLRERLFGTSTPKIESLAVLPLENLSGDPEQEYFVDGMHEELIATLAKIGALKVISRTSVMQYKQQRKPLPEIARELGVDAVIEGSVRRAGDQVRITVQLLDARADQHLWAESYQREIQDILALQSEVAQAIANEIKANLTPAEQALVARARPVNPEAYEAYLKGRHFWETRTPEGLQKALEYFEAAIATDPSYALGYAGVADTYYIMGSNRFLSPQESYPKARAAARKALELDANLAEAHTTTAAILLDYDWDWRAAERELNRALELNPGYATAHHYRAWLFSTIARHPEAIASIKKARSLDPLSPRINANVGFVLFFARQYDQAIQELEKALKLFPDDVAAHVYLGSTYLEVGLPEKAIAELRRSVALQPGYSLLDLILAGAYARAGKRQEATKIIETMLKGATRQYVPAYSLAQAYASLGEKDQAFAWLEKAYAERSPDMITLRVDPAFDPLRSDPRFQDLLRRMNFPD